MYAGPLQTCKIECFAVIVAKSGVVACACIPATSEAEFWNGVGSAPVVGNSPSNGGSTVWPPVIHTRRGAWLNTGT